VNPIEVIKPAGCSKIFERRLSVQSVQRNTQYTLQTSLGRL
jgi:hypothetical protein